MNSDLVFRLVDLAIALAQSQLEPGDATQVLVGIIQKGAQAYKDQTGKPLDPLLIKVEEPV